MEAWGFIHVLEEPPRGAHEYVHVVHFFLFLFDVFPPDEEGSAEGVFFPHFGQDLEDLYGQFTCGRDDDGTHTIVGGPSISEEAFEHRQ
eukprot:scaffold1645_cov288-Pavlova_lutheri.AAC.3